MTTPAAARTRPNRAAVATDTDAREFGLHMKQGGWRLGLLVARNVIRSPGRVSIESLAPKTNATRFAGIAKTTTDRVLRHLNAWEAAADAGLVPHAATLTPGAEINLDADALPLWTQFYRPEVRRTRPAPSPVTVTRPIAPEDPERDAIARVEQVARDTAARQERLAAQAAADAASERAVEEAGQRYRSVMAQGLAMPGDHSTDVDLNALAHDNVTAEVRDLITKSKWFTRRLFDLARDPAWLITDTTRADAAAEIHALATQLNLVADLAADPDSGRLTDETASALLES